MSAHENGKKSPTSEGIRAAANALHNVRAQHIATNFGVFLENKNVHSALKAGGEIGAQQSQEINKGFISEIINWNLTCSVVSSNEQLRRRKRVSAPSPVDAQRIIESDVLMLMALIEDKKIPQDTDIFSLPWCDDFVAMEAKLGQYDVVDAVINLRPENDRWSASIRAALDTTDWEKRKAYLQQSIAGSEALQEGNSHLRTEDLAAYISLLRTHDLPLPSPTVLGHIFARTFDQDVLRHALQITDHGLDFIMGVLANRQLTKEHLEVAQIAFDRINSHERQEKEILRTDMSEMSKALLLASDILGSVDWVGVKAKIDDFLPEITRDFASTGSMRQIRTLVANLLVEQYASESENREEVSGYAARFLQESELVSPYGVILREPLMIAAHVVAGLIHSPDSDFSQEVVAAGNINYLGEILYKALIGDGMLVVEDQKEIFHGGNVRAFAMLQLVKQKIKPGQFKQLKKILSNKGLGNNFNRLLKRV